LKIWLKSSAVKRAIIACRESDYHRELKLDIPEVYINSLTRNEIEAFCRKQLAEKADLILDQLFSTGFKTDNGAGHWSQMSQNPLFLDFLIQAFGYYQGKLPDNPGDLFQKLVDYLWRNEATKHTPGWIPLDEMKARLGKLAFAMINEEKGAEVDLDWALKQITNTGWLDLLDSTSRKKGLEFLQAAQGVSLIELRNNKDKPSLSFYHSIMQAYFAAEEIKAGPSIEFLNYSPRADYEVYETKDGSVLLSFGRIEGKWDQAIELLCGFTDNKDDIFKLVMEKDPYLAASCIQSGIEVSDTNRKQLIECLLSAIRKPAKADRQWTATAYLDIFQSQFMAQEGYEWQRLLRQLPDRDNWVRHIAATALSFIGEPVMLNLVSLLDSPDGDIASAAISGLFSIKQAFRKLLEIATTMDNLAGWTLRGILQSMTQSDPVVAEDLLSSVDMDLRKDSDGIGILGQRAALLQFMKRWSESLTLYSQCMDIAPAYTLAYSGKIYTIAEVKGEDAAVEAYAQAVKQGIESFSVLFTIGDIFWRKGEFKKAADAFCEAAALEPASFDSHVALGDCYTELGKPAKALTAYRKAIEISQRNSEIHSRIGLAYMDLKDYEKAIIPYATALGYTYETINRRFESSDHGNLAICYENTKQIRPAIRHYLMAAESAEQAGDNGDLMLWLSDLSRYYRRLGRNEEGFSASQRVLEIARKHQNSEFECDMLRNIGFIEMEFGSFETALVRFKEAVDVARSIDDQYRENMDLDNIGRCYCWLGETQRGLELQQRVLDFIIKRQARYEEAEILYTLASAAIDQRKYFKAIDQARKSLAIGEEIKDDAIKFEANYRLAMAYLLSGSPAAALKALRHAPVDDTSKYASKANALEGLIHLGLGDLTAAQAAFVKAILLANRLIGYSSRNYLAHDIKGLAYSGLTISRSNKYLSEAVAAFSAARALTKAPVALTRALLGLEFLIEYDAADLLASVCDAAAGRDV
ncbi:MAG: tetratricopeptide repeat protein, partial [Desulfobacteraceae bacterium]|jgi:tetratricopeptide (TPR) repeat protein